MHVGTGQPGWILSLASKDAAAAEEIAVRAAIQEIAVEHHRQYGYRRITQSFVIAGWWLIGSVSCG